MVISIAPRVLRGTTTCIGAITCFLFVEKFKNKFHLSIVLRAIPWPRLCIFAGKCHKKYGSCGPYYRRLYKCIIFFTIYYAWISYAFKSYIDNYFTHYQERRWRLKLQKTSLRLPLKKKGERKKDGIFFSQQIPLALVANPPVFTPISHQIWENINKWRRYSEMPGRYQSPDRLLYVHLQYFFLCVPG